MQEPVQCRVEMGVFRTIGGRRRRPQAENTDSVRFSQATVTISLEKKKKANKTNQETFVCCQMQVAEKQAEFLSYHTTWVNSPKNNYCSFKKKFSIPRGEVINQTDQGP